MTGNWQVHANKVIPRLIWQLFEHDPTRQTQRQIKQVASSWSTLTNPYRIWPSRCARGGECYSTNTGLTTQHYCDQISFSNTNRQRHTHADSFIQTLMSLLFTDLGRHQNWGVESIYVNNIQIYANSIQQQRELFQLWSARLETIARTRTHTLTS